MNRNEYLSERQVLINLEAEAYRSFDKTLITVSSGAIALSIGFFGRVDITHFKILLLNSWLLWLCSIILQLISLYITPKAMREEQAILNERYLGSPERKNKFVGRPSIFNLLSLGAFGLGTVLFIILVMINF